MAVPSPSIKPLRKSGGNQSAVYMGHIGVNTGGGPGAYATAIASFGFTPYGNPPAIPQGDQVRVGPDNVLFNVVSVTDQGSGSGLMELRAANRGVYANGIPIGSEVRFVTPVQGYSEPGYTTTVSSGGVDAGDSEHVNVDLTDFPEALRIDTFFVDQVRVEIRVLDGGINIQSQVLTRADFVGSPIVQYLVLPVQSDDAANELIVEVTLPHTHMR